MSLSHSDRRLVADYFRALRNEVALDRKDLMLSRLPRRAQVMLPRPPLWLSWGRRIPWFLPLIAGTASAAWRIFGPVYFALQRHPLLGEDLQLQAQPLGQILAFTSRCGDIVHEEHIQPLPSQWLVLPWASLENLPAGSETTPLLSLLSSAELNHTLRLSCYAHHIVYRRARLRAHGLQTYTAWRWFAVRLAVDKLPGPLLMVEHFDRWAVLADASAAASRRIGRPRPLTLMQHGFIGEKNSTSLMNVSLPTRLRAVTRLHVYSDSDAAIFKQSVLSQSCNRRGVEVSFFHPSIKLTRSPIEPRPRVLFVGHPICENLHVSVLNTLIQNRELKVYYKPHPSAKRDSAVIARQMWIVIQGKTEFPEVDLLVSYPSTMVTEYERHGIPSVVHPMNLSAQDAASLAAEIEVRLDEWDRARSSLNGYCGHPGKAEYGE